MYQRAGHWFCIADDLESADAKPGNYHLQATIESRVIVVEQIRADAARQRISFGIDACVAHS
jgi:hypothetical protein